MPSGFVSPYEGPKGRAWRGVIRYRDLEGVERRKKVTLGPSADDEAAVSIPTSARRP